MEQDFSGLFLGKSVSESNVTSEKVVLFFRSGCSKRKFVFHFFKAILDTSLFQPFPTVFLINVTDYYWLSAKMVNAIPGGNLLALNFAYHFPNPWTDLVCPLNARSMHPTFSHKASFNSFSGGRVGDSPSRKPGCYGNWPWDPLLMTQILHSWR